MERWKPTVECSAREQRLLKLAGKSRKLFVFLREHRRELFDDAFQNELEAMYRQTGQGVASSIKAGLDIDWSAPDAKSSALNRLCAGRGFSGQ